MTRQSLDAHYGRTVDVDLCHACGGLWFDANESLALTPGSVLQLFARIAEGRRERRPPPGTLTCPRCHRTLVATADLQRDTAFGYWRCASDHGRFITFADFLREKNFVRPLTGRELAKLRANVQMVHCSSCGAPIDVARTSSCAYCRAPVSVIDAHQVETAVGDLRRAEAERRAVDPALLRRLVTERLTAR
jgi:hypothetical protein